MYAQFKRDTLKRFCEKSKTKGLNLKRVSPKVGYNIWISIRGVKWMGLGWA